MDLCSYDHEGPADQVCPQFGLGEKDHEDPLGLEVAGPELGLPGPARRAVDGRARLLLIYERRA